MRPFGINLTIRSIHNDDSNDCDACRTFVEGLIAAATANLSAGTESARRRWLAKELVYSFVPRVSMAGVDIRRLIAGRDRVLPERVCAEEVSSAVGFKPELTRGGQGGEVVRHVAAAAAAVLMRRRWLVWAAGLVDRAQALVRENRAESRAEVAGNRAGVQAGRILDRLVSGRIDVEDARRKLRRLLCELRSQGTERAPPLQ